MGAYRDILVAFDGSADAERALELAIELARGGNGRLTVLTAARQVPYPAYSGASGQAVAELRRSVVVEAEQLLEAAAKRVPRSIPLTKVFSRRPIRTALLRRIEEGGHDLVVLGSRGRGRVGSAFHRSVSRYMLRRSPVPVLISHASARGADGREPSPAATLGGDQPVVPTVLPN